MNKTLSEEEKEKRHRKWVQDAEKNGRYEIENVFQITLKTTGASENLGKLDIFHTDPNEPTNLLAASITDWASLFGSSAPPHRADNAHGRKLAAARNQL